MSGFELHAPKGAKKRHRPIGRGEGSGHGGTSGKGHKGQKARSGGNVRLGFEGGQMPLYRRIARRGFSNYHFKNDYTIVNVSSLEKKFKNGEVVDTNELFKRGIIKKSKMPVKLLGNGDLSLSLTVKLDKISASARKKVEAAGGTLEVTSEQSSE
ncbi:MAG: 50S ribosomal protein L15 [Spirochaetales bacterium]|nr:50S ribosomal protein L15 [Spirochaetales bacterium]MCF7937804.1 50S ribosomal protein L15 [Spirochaetales bacterium]